MANSEGKVLDGKYEILKEVGRGGMSIVYIAMDKRLNKQWAVKEIKNDGSKSTETLLKGLEREANILKSVDHPVIPRIVDIINDKGVIYVVMDYVEGEDCETRIKRDGAQDQELVIDWAISLAEGLDYLHNMNPPIIYRDMKPGNVMIRPEGGIKLIDFGTAKEYIEESIADTTALGTKGYAAPEQYGDSYGKAIYKTDARTDIYNLGVTLFRMVTGEDPNTLRPIREVNPALSTGLEKIIKKCTEHEPANRYQNCKELIYDLEHYTELDDEHKKKNKIKIAVWALFVVLTIAAGVVSYTGYRGLRRIKLENYNKYVDQGNEYRLAGEYRNATETYKLAIDLEGRETEAYIRFIETYKAGSKDLDENGNPALDLQTGLNYLAGKVREGYGKVDKNDEVLYNLALTYFVELQDYKVAAQYFDMVDGDDKTYGDLADYYGAVANILSSGNMDKEELLVKLGEFAAYNSDHFTNNEEDKFINYRTIGNIYATYITDYESASKAEEVMAQAISDLDSCTATDEIIVNDYYYSYYDNMITITSMLASKEEIEINRDSYLLECADYCDSFLNMLELKLEQAEIFEIGGENNNSFNTDYVRVMLQMASAYAGLSDVDAYYDKVCEVYEELEGRIGKNNVRSSKVYTEHLDYLFTHLQNKDQDPNNWSSKYKSKFDDLCNVYKEGKVVTGIGEEQKWTKRKSTIDIIINNANKPVETVETTESADENEVEE